MWADNKKFKYNTNDFLLGVHNEKGNLQKVGVKTERHAITIAGAGSGKGVAVIIPNLLHWHHNVLVIDPKGEAVEATAKRRKDMGQSVHVIAPFDEGKIDSQFLASYNPLDFINVDGLTARDDVELIADGIVLQNPKDPESHWDEGTRALISGVIAYVLLTEKPENKNLITVRQIIADKNKLDDAMTQATKMTGLDDLAMDGASSYFAKEAGYFVSNAEKHTRWLSNKAMRRVLTTSSFSLDDLKHGHASVYLVLPAKYISRHGRFLRLFVRCAIEAMQNETIKFRDKQCLFLLDEFFALGYIKEIAVSAGLMRGYGLQLWPIMQDLGQLETLYGREGMQTFFGNSDVHQFFGNTDAMTLEYISTNLGGYTLNELLAKAEFRRDRRVTKYSETDGIHNTMIANMNLDTVNALKGEEGKPRLRPDQVSHVIANNDDGFPVSRESICFVRGRQFLKVHLLPYWLIGEVEQNEKERSMKAFHKHLKSLDLDGKNKAQRIEKQSAHDAQQAKFSKRRRYAVYAVVGYGVLWVVGTIFQELAA